MKKKRKKTKIKKVPFSEKILNFLGEKTLELFDLSAMMIFDPKNFVRTYGISGLYKNSYYYFPREFSNLKKSPYFQQKGDKFYVTEKGRIKIIKNILKDKEKNKKWNGKWLAIAFDIPEATRKERNFLRTELKWIGLKEFQHSIWITPWDIEKELFVLLNLWHKDFSGDIRIMRMDKISGDEELKRIFGLK